MKDKFLQAYKKRYKDSFFTPAVLLSSLYCFYMGETLEFNIANLVTTVLVGFGLVWLESKYLLGE